MLKGSISALTVALVAVLAPAALHGLDKTQHDIAWQGGVTLSF
jgi:hypothetical protein